MNVKLYNDDCLNVLNGIEDNSIDLVVSDPPYKTTSRGNSGIVVVCYKKILT